MFLKSTLLAFFYCCSLSVSFAAFPINCKTTGNGSIHTQRQSSEQQGSAGKGHKVVYKSRGTAKLLGILGIVGLGIHGLHQFYLGYPVTGAIELITGLAAIALVGITFGVFWFAILAFFATEVWQIVDVCRIGSGKLKPKWGYYYDEINTINKQKP